MGRLHVQEHGSPDRPPLVLLHAFPMDSRMWERLLPRLGDWRALAVDLPGLGGSAVPPEQPTMAAAAALVRQELDHRGVEAATVVGISTGGYVAMELTAAHPDAVAALVLGSTSAEVGEPDPPVDRRRHAAELRSTGTIDAVADSRQDALGLTSRRERPELQALVDAMVLEADPIGAAWMADAIATRREQRATLASFAGPVLLLFGDEDVATPPSEHLPGLRDPRPDDDRTRVVRLDRAGHLTPLERPEAVADALAWLQPISG
jgi:pimeloyl-ACP methyl ester carboxylesterase